MDIYENLAQDLMAALDRRKCPPHEEVSAARRGEMAVLRLLEDEERALSAGEISRLLSMTTSRIAAVLGALEKKALIVRSADARDKRRVQVTLTEKGRLLCRGKKQAALEHIRFTLSQLGEQDAQEFVRLMKRVFNVMPPHPGTCLREEKGLK